MKTLLFLVVLVPVLTVALTPLPASAALLDSFTDAASQIYAFIWTTVATWSNTSPSGSVERAEGQASGSGTFTVAPTATGYAFTFSGTGGQGSGTTDANGLIVNEGPFKIGGIDYPFPAGVPDSRPGTFLSQGQLVLTPGHVDVNYTDITRTNTFGVSASTTFVGSGERATVKASEPLGVVAVAIGLALAARLRRRGA
jgi:hypothetical protein